MSVDVYFRNNSHWSSVCCVMLQQRDSSFHPWLKNIRELLGMPRIHPCEHPYSLAFAPTLPDTYDRAWSSPSDWSPPAPSSISSRVLSGDKLVLFCCVLLCNGRRSQPFFNPKFVIKPGAAGILQKRIAAARQEPVWHLCVALYWLCNYVAMLLCFRWPYDSLP